MNYTTFPYAGQVRLYSEYLVIDLPEGALQITLSEMDARIGLDVWVPPSTSLSCTTPVRWPRCMVEASPGGEMRIRAGGEGRFVLDIRPAPHLESQYVHVADALAIPDGDPTGLSDTLTGSAVTAILRATVEVYVRHGQPQELTFVIVSPTGTEVQLVQDNASDSTPYEGVTYDDFALEPEAGLFRDASFVRRPSRPLHVLTDTDANGTWTLRVVDTLAANIQDDTGELLGWGLSFY